VVFSVRGAGVALSSLSGNPGRCAIKRPILSVCPSFAPSGWRYRDRLSRPSMA
jgi:hypothetical protein